MAPGGCWHNGAMPKWHGVADDTTAANHSSTTDGIADDITAAIYRDI